MVRPEQLVELCKARHLSLATAESCTAGLIASLLAAVPGCGEVLDRGYVVYTPEAKHECLGVDYATIEKYGLSSVQVAEEMALGALQRSRASISIANTGIAQAQGPMDGVVYFAWAARAGQHEKVITERVKFAGSRNQVREAAASYALDKVADHMKRFWTEDRAHHP